MPSQTRVELEDTLAVTIPPDVYPSTSRAVSEEGREENTQSGRRSTTGRELLIPTETNDNIIMFDNAQNMTITGGTFVQQNGMGATVKDPFKVLQKRVATSAFHNSAQRVDPPRCHPNTRIEILRFIYAWIIKSFSSRREWILWLNGAAGAGKSAIVQSLAEQCALASIAVASFFFFRNDPSRNNVSPFIPTVVYQLLQAIPEVLDTVMRVIERNPLIFDESLESQIQQLIVQPLLQLPCGMSRPFVIFIDGLDECTDRGHQVNLIRVLGTISSRRELPLIFLIASRREPQIEAAFVRRSVSSLLHIQALDNADIEQTSSDIREFLNSEFNDIKQTHLRKHLIPNNWPSTSAVEEIVEKSSGQFIYALVVIKYVSSPRGNPARQLDIVRNVLLRTASVQNPFAHLDALYRYILSQVERIEDVFDVLAYALLTEITDIPNIENAFEHPTGEVEVLLADFAALIACESYYNSTQIKFLHKSLPDFLLDKSRSEEFYIDMNVRCLKLLCMFLEKSPSKSITLSTARITALDILLKKVKMSQQLHCAALAFKFSMQSRWDNYQIIVLVKHIIGVVDSFKCLSGTNHTDIYSHIVDTFAVQLAKNWTFFHNEVKAQVEKSCPDLLVRIQAIHRTSAKPVQTHWSITRKIAQFCRLKI
ncbi:hypothetical protein BDN70DRAFT_856948 [Pholiota conissans]|uniref:NACHT domain-containing protein n=1 Tax=Pholiota conissans TaxID=109636 RepID=A0A9P6CV76_9AGAR|nr:hypothetical protein BDN70DRAFT_856948 [Pholiota conissans]